MTPDNLKRLSIVEAQSAVLAARLERLEAALNVYQTALTAIAQIATSALTTAADKIKDPLT